MSSHSYFSIISTSETCCLLVVVFYDSSFLTRSYFDYLLLLGLKVSYKNQQFGSDIILIITFLQSYC
jgi:hypothetical protein